MNEARIRQACTDLIVRYAYLNDERRFEELAALFTEDAVLYRPSAPGQGIAGRRAILDAFRKRPAGTMTFHVTSDVLVEVQDAENAGARSRILLLSAVRPQDGSVLPVETKAPVPGVFRDRLVLTDDGWKFSERRGMFWI
ncbi:MULTISPECIES: nuclear transport factor 2 family protein [unclassified Massilia]|uniref:nuclear transport factor 2 family protein n=1 Tax=unclassified Massilia TaxID=2609279 RepID=UPI001786A8B7|nr:MULTISPECIES: nuclear transport factor 2 family protein [unclassified Massilia]MBD8529314.1 nuclear transport factor 2 family protein [Massilia sp. CFBP 13647]MBD8672708.1 nuclear transport factor 2 family protein [Massilia sp. CFBP 13721]